MKHTLLLLLLGLPAMLLAQFTTDARLTNATGNSYTPYNNSRCIGVNGQVVHIAFTDRRTGEGELYYKRSNDGGASWTNDILLSPEDNLFSGRATIAVWGDEVHLVWMDSRDGNRELYYKRSTDGGQTWSNDTRLTNSAGDSEYPSLAIEFQTLHLVWNDDRNGQNEIYYKRSTNGGLSWGADTRLINNIDESQYASVAASGANVHVVWEDHRDGNGEIYYKRSVNAGANWGNDVRLTNSAPDNYAPCVSANGTVVFASWDDSRTGPTEIYSRRSVNNGDTWAAEVNLSTSGAASYYNNHAFAGPFLFLAWEEENGGGTEVYSRFSSDAGLTWAAIDPITNADGASSQPFMAFGNSAIHLVWSDDRDGNQEIYYSRNPNGFPFDNVNALQFGQGYGSPNQDVGYAIATDLSGNGYVTGWFEGTIDFDPGPATVNLVSAGSTDVFICKYSPAGNLLWARRMGGQEEDKSYSIALDQMGNVLTTGYFHATADFDPGNQVSNLTSGGEEDIFISKLDPSGNFIWAKKMGSDDRDESRYILTDQMNNVMLTGFFTSTADFDPGPNILPVTTNGEDDIFVAKLDPNGNLDWAYGIGGGGFDAGRGMALDLQGNILITGFFEGFADFDPGIDIALIPSNGESDIFILSLNPLGDFVSAKKIGGTLADEGNSVAVDPDGFIYMTGYFRSTVNFNPGGTPFNLTSAGNEDIFIAKLDPDFNHVWAGRCGGPQSDEARSIAFHNDYMYLTGTFQGTADFNPDNRVTEIHSSGNDDIFLLKLTSGGAFTWLSQLGGTGQDVGYAIAPVSYGQFYVTGYYEGTADVDPQIGFVNFTSAGNEDILIARMRDCSPQKSAIMATACDSYLAPDGITVWTASGQYTDTIASSSGCDSIIIVNLTILQSSFVTVTETACDSYTTSSGLHTWTTSGVYEEVFANATSCDSVITYQLTILNSTTFTIDAEACDEYLAPDGQTVWTESGVYTMTFPNAAGCDSVITINLTINTATSAVFGVDACDSYTTPGGDSTWYVSGIYTYTIPNAAGCDSVITLDLAITNFNTGVTQNESTLTADVAGLLYQWVDCDQNFGPVPGETGQSFTATASGSYAVIIHNGECADTSACFPVTIVDVYQPEPFDRARVYPNPSTGKIYVDIGHYYPDLRVVLRDLYGRRLLTSGFTENDRLELDLNYPSGMYILTLAGDRTTRDFRIIIQ